MKLQVKDSNSVTKVELDSITVEDCTEDAEYVWECIEEEEEWVVDELVSALKSKAPELDIVSGDIDSPFTRLELQSSTGQVYSVELEEGDDE